MTGHLFTLLYMIYGELGRFPLVIYVKSRMINYWCRMLNNDNKNKLSFRIYNALLSDYVYGTHLYKWFNFVENIFNETGFTYVWLSQNIVNYGNVSNIILETLRDQYLQLWRDNIYYSGKGTD